MRDHRKLKAFQKADELVLAVYGATSKLPAEERFGLAAQLRRAAVSIGSNIVEGSACDSEAEYLRFLEIAFRSAREVEYQLSLAARLGYLEAKHRETLPALTNETCALLIGLIKSLKQRKSP